MIAAIFNNEKNMQVRRLKLQMSTCEKFVDHLASASFLHGSCEKSQRDYIRMMQVLIAINILWDTELNNNINSK